MSATREVIEKSWRATKRRADATGLIKSNHASAAGQYLEMASGDAQRAIAMLPPDGGAFWALVATYLALLVQEDRRESGTQLKTGT